MWEWRAFGPADLLAPPRRTLEEPVSVEERTDLYLLVRGDLGLKVRALHATEKCELKQRYERTPSGLEHWEKLFEKKLPLDALWFRELGRFLDVKNDALVGAASGSRELGQLCRDAGLATPHEVSVRKEISKAPIPPAYSCESCELEIAVGGGAPLRVRSIAVEAATRELCLETGKKLGLPRADEPGLDPRVIVAGYPEALARLLLPR